MKIISLILIYFASFTLHGATVTIVPSESIEIVSVASQETGIVVVAYRTVCIDVNGNKTYSLPKTETVDLAQCPALHRELIAALTKKITDTGKKP